MTTHPRHASPLPLGLPPPLPTNKRAPASHPQPRKRRRSSPSHSTPSTATPPSRSKPNIYAATSGLLAPHPSKPPSHPRTKAPPLTPFEALTRRRRAPVRYEAPERAYDFHLGLAERQTRRADIYANPSGIPHLRDAWARSEQRAQTRSLQTRRSGREREGSEDAGTEAGISGFLKRKDAATLQRRRTGLPHSDICKALLRYASYHLHALSPEPPSSHPRPRPHIPSVQSLDETALLALSILLEETVRGSVAPQLSSTENGADATRDVISTREEIQGQGWRALLVGLRSSDDEDAVDVVDGAGMRAITGGGRMGRDMREWRGRKRRGGVEEVEDARMDVEAEGSGEAADADEDEGGDDEGAESGSDAGSMHMDDGDSGHEDSTRSDERHRRT